MYKQINDQNGIVPQAGEAFLAENGAIGAQEGVLEDATIDSKRADVEYLATSFLIGVISYVQGLLQSNIQRKIEMSMPYDVLL